MLSMRCLRLRRRIRGALHLLACLFSLADSDPKARSALGILEEGKIDSGVYGYGVRVRIVSLIHTSGEAGALHWAQQSCA